MIEFSHQIIMDEFAKDAFIEVENLIRGQQTSYEKVKTTDKYLVAKIDKLDIDAITLILQLRARSVIDFLVKELCHLDFLFDDECQKALDICCIVFPIPETLGDEIDPGVFREHLRRHLDNDWPTICAQAEIKRIKPFEIKKKMDTISPFPFTWTGKKKNLADLVYLLSEAKLIDDNEIWRKTATNFVQTDGSRFDKEKLNSSFHKKTESKKDLKNRYKSLIDKFNSV